MAFLQYVCNNGLLGYQITLLYDYNVNTEAFRQYVCENGLLVDLNESLHNHNVDTEDFHFFVAHYIRLSTILFKNIAT